MLTKKNDKTQLNKYLIIVSKNEPYLVSGSVPLSEKIIKYDSKWDSCEWQDGKTHSMQDQYELCRCGQSNNKPFCDRTHLKIKFDGSETASHALYCDQAVVLEGPVLKMTDAKILCASARFCHRGDGAWALILSSNNPGDREMVIEEVADCPSGRLVVYDKETGKSVEPTFEPSIVLIEDPYIKVSGPLWIRGGIQIKSSDGILHETRNRVTLCRCGKSQNKPYCDSSHYPE